MSYSFTSHRPYYETQTFAYEEAEYEEVQYVEAEYDETEAEADRIRALAQAAFDKRSSCYERSRAAFASGQKALAKQLSNEGKEHGRKGDEYNRQARDYISQAKNAGRADDEIDLHGLYVQEAKDILRARIQAERRRGASGLHVIVGKGNHTGGSQRIKPAVEALCHELNLPYSGTEQNPGRMYIWI